MGIFWIKWMFSTKMNGFRMNGRIIIIIYRIGSV